MRRLRLPILILALLPLLLVSGPRADAGDARRIEREMLQKTYRMLGDLAMQYAELADFYKMKGMDDLAAAARETMVHLVARQGQVAKRIESLVAAAPAAALPADRERVGPTPRIAGRAGGRIVPGAGVGGGFGLPAVPTSGIYRGRGGRRNLRTEGGGGTQGAVDLGLEWLKNHQDPEGFWDCDGFSKQCKLNACGGPGYALYDPGVTGLALCAFLGTGETHKSGRYRQTVKSGLKYLKQIQDPEGCFGVRETNRFTYNHGCASLAMIEAYALTGSPLYKQSAQQAVDFILACQNPYLGWRYGTRPGDNDTSVTGWMVMALVSGLQAGGLRVPTSSLDGARAWIEKVTEPEYGKVGYTARGTGPARPQDIMDRFPPDRSEALTAAGLTMRIMMGEDPEKSEPIQKGVELCLKALPEWDEAKGTIDMYYWFYGSIALHQIGGDAWKRWNAAMKAAVVNHQRKDGDEKGSWDPHGPWGREGGRIYSTALMTMCLETYYRYVRIHADRPRIRVPAVKIRPDLTRKVSFALAEAPIAEALELIARTTGTRFLFEGGARDVIIEKTMTLSVTDLDLRSVLDLIAAYGDLRWTVRGDAVVFLEK